MNLDEIAEGLYLEDYIKGQKKEIEDKLKNESLLKSYKRVISDADGKRVIWDILTMCRVFHLSMTGNSWTYFNEGGRQIGLYIMSMLSVGNTIEDLTSEFKKIKPEVKDGGNT